MTEPPGHGSAPIVPGATPDRAPARATIRAPALRTIRAPALRTILAAAFVTLTVVAVLIVGSFAGYNNYSHRKRMSFNELGLKASLAAQAVARGLNGEAELLTIAALVGQKDFSDREAARVFLARMLANRKIVRSLAILDRSGGEVASYSRYQTAPETADGADRRIEPAEMLVGQPHFGPVWYWPKTNEPFVTLFIPTGTIHGKRPDWVVRADLNISVMQRTVKRFTGERLGRAFIVDSAGRLLAHGDSARVLRGETLPPGRVAAIFKNSPDQARREITGENGEAMLAAAARIGQPDWAVVIEAPRALAMAGSRRALYAIGLVTLLVSAVAAAAGILLARRLAAPINGLIVSAEKMAQGDFAVAVPVAGVHEVHVLGDTLKAMAGRLERTMGDLKRENARRVEAQRDAQQAREEAEHASRAKSSFLAHMSHELRTPLNAVIGFSEALQGGLGGTLSDKQAEYVGDIHDSGRHLLSLISDVLDLSKIEAGRLEIEESEIDLGKTLEQSMRFVKEQALNGGVALRADLADGLFKIRADARMVKQMVVNLLSNAVKFTQAGGEVVVSAGLRPMNANGLDGGGAGANGANAGAGANGSNGGAGANGAGPNGPGPGTLGAFISVADNGAGMAPGDIPKALAPFERTESGKNKEGTGLGLPLVKRMAELHGGGLTLESTQGAGTTATITFPPVRVIG